MKAILLADDDEDVRTVFGRSLERYYRVLEAATGTSALELTKRERPDLVIEILSETTRRTDEVIKRKQYERD